MDKEESNYRAAIKEQNNVDIKGRSFGSKIRNLKKLANINCKTTHIRQTIFSEFYPTLWGIFYYNKKTGSLDAWIEWK